MSAESYIEFLKTKIPQAEVCGFDPPSPHHECLFPHQRDISTWGIRGGRRAIFANFGLGKTRMNLQIALWVIEQTFGRFLIIAPLGVRQEFTQSDGPAMGLQIEFCRTDAEIAASSCDIIITNYESVRDGKIDVNQFAGVALDEASCLRSYGSQTYQTFLPLFKSIPYRFVFTATPSPNRYKELIHYAGFLGIMDTGEALTRFFQRDSEKAGNLTLYPHMEKQFWLWVLSWAVFITKPSDLGYSDEGYDLPPLNIIWHKVDVDHKKAWKQYDNHGQAQLLVDQATGLKASAEFKRDSVGLRIAKAKEIISDGEGEWEYPTMETLEHSVINHALSMVENFDIIRRIQSGSSAKEAIGTCGSSVPVQWQSGKAGIGYLSEDGSEALIKWKTIEERAKLYIYTPVHWLVWHDLESERHAIEKQIPSAKTVYGTMDLEKREGLIMGFARGEYPILATKPIIAGSGCNFQRHCHNAIFLGVGYKFNDFIQAVHRIQRFQQPYEVNIHIIYLESESSIMEALKHKWRLHDELMERMTALLKEHKLSHNTTMELIRTMGVDRAELKGQKFRAIHNDCVLETQTWPDNCVDFICTSIPFGNQYEYSPTFEDFGHNSDNEKFFQQMDFLCPELLRILQPGRIAAIHVKDRIRFGNVTGDGFPTVDRFSDKTADCFERAGFRLMARITVVTDVVRENNQTYRLGWSENAKDSSKMGAGMPEYVLVFRKLPSDQSNGYADKPVTKSKEEYTRADWQLDAGGFWRSNGNRMPDPESMIHVPFEDLKRYWIQYSLEGGYSHDEHVALAKALEDLGKLPSSFELFPAISRDKDVWTDIARMRTLNNEQNWKGEEKHVCPLQLDIIKRLITRYTNEGEIVYDPFGGIGSVPYQAIRMGRIGWSTELNKEYWRFNAGYCEAAEAEMSVPTLFDMSSLGEAPRMDAEPESKPKRKKKGEAA